LPHQVKNISHLELYAVSPPPQGALKRWREHYQPRQVDQG